MIAIYFILITKTLFLIWLNAIAAHNTLFRLGVTKAKSSSSKKQRIGQSEAEANAQDTLHSLVFQFTNNGGHSDRTATDVNLRSIINYSIDNASLLKNYHHLGKNKFADICLKTYQEFRAEVKAKIDECRQHYIDTTVSNSAWFVTIHSHHFAYCDIK